MCVRARGLCGGPGVSAMGPWGGRFPVKDVLGGRSRWAGATTARRRAGVRWGRPVLRAARLPGPGAAGAGGWAARPRSGRRRAAGGFRVSFGQPEQAFTGTAL